MTSLGYRAWQFYRKTGTLPIRNILNKNAKEYKYNNLLTGKKDYSALIASYISKDWQHDLKTRGYAILDIDPIHTGRKARIRACILIEKGLLRANIKTILKIANESVRKMRVFSNERQETRHSEKDADVVLLFVFNERRHKRYLQTYKPYFVCQTQWIRPGLDPSLAQRSIGGEEIIDNIEIKWNHNYGDKRETC